MITITQAEFSGWSNCYWIANNNIKLTVTADVGPHIIFFGFTDGPNELAILPDDAGHTGGDEFKFYGGHRLWHAPEDMPRSYAPDNNAVQIEEFKDFLRVTAPIEETTMIQKQIDLAMSEDQPHVRLSHRLINRGLWTVELAPWALTMCAPGGTGIAPLPAGGKHDTKLIPATSLSLWAYTKMNDPRWTWGERVIMLRQDTQNDSPQKAGLYAEDGWIACANYNHLLLKTIDAGQDGPYPDPGCNVELFANGEFLEIETLGPLTQLEPGQSVELVEDWYLLDDIPQPESEIDVIQHLIPRIVAVLEKGTV